MEYMIGTGSAVDEYIYILKNRIANVEKKAHRELIYSRQSKPKG